MPIPGLARVRAGLPCRTSKVCSIRRGEAGSHSPKCSLPTRHERPRPAVRADRRACAVHTPGAGPGRRALAGTAEYGIRLHPRRVRCANVRVQRPRAGLGPDRRVLGTRARVEPRIVPVLRARPHPLARRRQRRQEEEEDTRPCPARGRPAPDIPRQGAPTRVPRLCPMVRVLSPVSLVRAR
jgi:hypothetical protein